MYLTEWPFLEEVELGNLVLSIFSDSKNYSLILPEEVSKCLLLKFAYWPFLNRAAVGWF